MRLLIPIYRLALLPDFVAGHTLELPDCLSNGRHIDTSLRFEVSCHFDGPERELTPLPLLALARSASTFCMISSSDEEEEDDLPDRTAWNTICAISDFNRSSSCERSLREAVLVGVVVTAAGGGWFETTGAAIGPRASPTDRPTPKMTRAAAACARQAVPATMGAALPEWHLHPESEFRHRRYPHLQVAASPRDHRSRSSTSRIESGDRK